MISAVLFDRIKGLKQKAHLSQVIFTNYKLRDRVIQLLNIPKIQTTKSEIRISVLFNKNFKKK
jgi:hypothetical protein